MHDIFYFLVLLDTSPDYWNGVELLQINMNWLLDYDMFIWSEVGG